MKKSAAIGTIAAAFISLSAASALAQSDANISCPEDKPFGELTEDEKKACAESNEDYREALELLGYTFDEAAKNNDDDEFVVRLHGNVTTPSAKKVIEQLRELSAEDPTRDITFYINTSGGLLGEAIAIYDVMQDIPNDIKTVCENRSMSAGILLLSAGTPGKRYALPHCDIMAHQSNGGAIGNIEDTRIRAEFNDRLNETMLELISNHSGWDVDVLTDMLSSDVYLTPEQAIDMGFIDAILEPSKPAPTPGIRTDVPSWFCEGERGNISRACVGLDNN